MTWLVWLGLAVIIAAVAAGTGLQPKGTRPYLAFERAPAADAGSRPTS